MAFDDRDESKTIISGEHADLLIAVAKNLLLIFLKMKTLENRTRI